jgi:AcrR family transcriptional regulator
MPGYASAEMTKNMTPRSQGKRSDAVRNESSVRIAARQTFDRLGGDLTMDDVAAEAGLSKGTVYRVFPTRDALLEEMTLELLGEVTKAYANAKDSDDPLGVLAEVLRTRPGTAAGRARMTAPGQRSSRVRRALADTARELEELLDVMKSKGLVDPGVTAWHIRVLTRGLNSVLSDYPTHSSADVEQLTSIILRGITPAAGSSSR